VPARRHGFSSCTHKGFGSKCARCAQADQLEAKLPSNVASEEYGKMRAEVERLRGPQTRHKKFRAVALPPQVES